MESTNKAVYYLPNESNMERYFIREDLLAKLRWALIIWFLITILIFKSEQLSLQYGFLFLIIALIYNVLVNIGVRIKYKTSLSIITFLFDSIFATLLVFFSKGINSEFWPLFLVLLISSSTLLEMRNNFFLFIYLGTLYFIACLPNITMPYFWDIFLTRIFILAISTLSLGYLSTLEKNMREEITKVAMENASLYEKINNYNNELQTKISEATEEIKKKYAQLEILFKTHKIISSDIELDKTLTAIIKSVQEGLGFDRVGIFEVDEQHNIIRGRIGIDKWGKPENIENQVYSLDENDNNFAKIAKGRLDYFYTENADKSLPPSQMKYMIKGVGQNVVVPMKARGKIIGMIAVDNFISKKPITEEDVHLLITFADQAASAIFNAKAYEIEKEMLNRLTKLEEEKNEFIAKMSHELKTPLTSINESIKIILKRLVGEVTPNQEKFLTIAKKNSERLAKLITELFEAVNSSGQKMFLEISNINIVNLINDIITDLKPLAENKKIDIEINILCNQEDANISGDYNKIYRALLNIIENSIKYSNYEGKIKIDIYEQKQQLFVEVQDNGIGIDKDQIDKIFEKFYQIKDPVIKYQTGVGLGLSIAKEIIEAHNGSIKAESKGRGFGTKFTIMFPKGN